MRSRTFYRFSPTSSRKFAEAPPLLPADYLGSQAQSGRATSGEAFHFINKMAAKREPWIVKSIWQRAKEMFEEDMEIEENAEDYESILSKSVEKLELHGGHISLSPQSAVSPSAAAIVASVAPNATAVTRIPSFPPPPLSAYSAYFTNHYFRMDLCNTQRICDMLKFLIAKAELKKKMRASG
ncbi:hypothetical protein TNCV_13591 [Trichonephila clavipes]|nr:hypothetical protein TNCV_13591 [Trichonephila clavipes]